MRAELLEPFLLCELKRLKCPVNGSKQDIFEYSVQKWTYHEILSIIKANPKKNLVDLLEKFIDKINNFICLSVTERQKDQYIIIHDTAEWIVETII